MLQMQNNTLLIPISVTHLSITLAQAANVKGLFSNAYTYFLVKILHNNQFCCKQNWGEDLGPTSNDTWDDVLQSVQIIYLFSSHRLAQPFILHRVYFPSKFLFRIGLHTNFWCNIHTVTWKFDPPSVVLPQARKVLRWVISTFNGVLIHTWKLILLHAWRLILFNGVFDTQLDLCILGYFDSSALDDYTFLAILRLVFVACSMMIFKMGICNLPFPL